MPYFITDDAEGCAGWATVKDDGTVMGCHGSKAGAIAQAVAIAQAEGSTFEGERALRVLPVQLPSRQVSRRMCRRVAGVPSRLRVLQRGPGERRRCSGVV
jgi:hypothetical protein